MRTHERNDDNVRGTGTTLKRRSAALATAAAAAVCLTLLGSSTASAGTNGQQVKVSTRYSDIVQVCGTNQHNTPNVCTPWFAVPGGDGDYTGVVGWWYKGKVTIHGYQRSKDKYRTGTCDVPVSQGPDWTYCNGYAAGL